jgi:hypothetical protein
MVISDFRFTPARVSSLQGPSRTQGNVRKALRPQRALRWGNQVRRRMQLDGDYALAAARIAATLALAPLMMKPMSDMELKKRMPFSHQGFRAGGGPITRPQ